MNIRVWSTSVRKILAGIFLFGSLVGDGGCTVKVANKSAKEMFPEPQVAALADAAANGNVGEVDRLIKTGVHVDGLGYQHTTPLTFAMLAPNLNGMEALLKNGANPNHRMDDPVVFGGLPIILFLPRSNHAPLMELMLKYGANPNTRQPVKKALAKEFPYEGDSLLILSVMSLDNVKVLIKYGADVNLRPQTAPNGHGGATAATVAAGLGQLDVLDFLLEHGTTVDLDNIADALQGRNWAPAAKAHRIKLLERIHAMGAKIYSAYKPMKSTKVEAYAAQDTPQNLLSPGYYEPKPYKGDTPVKLPEKLQ